MNWRATQLGSVLESVVSLPDGGVRWKAPDCERTLPKASGCHRPEHAAARPPALDPATTVWRGSLVKWYRPCAQGSSSVTKARLNSGLQGSSRSRAPGALLTNSAITGGLRPSAIRLSRIVGVGTRVRYSSSSNTTSSGYGSACGEYWGGRYMAISRSLFSAA